MTLLYFFFMFPLPTLKFVINIRNSALDEMFMFWKSYLFIVEKLFKLTINTSFLSLRIVWRFAITYFFTDGKDSSVQNFYKRKSILKQKCCGINDFCFEYTFCNNMLDKMLLIYILWRILRFKIDWDVYKVDICIFRIHREKSL